MPTGIYIRNPETEKKRREKISAFFKGRKLSDEHKRKMSENNARYWKGKTRGKVVFSEEAKKNIRDAQRAYYENGGKGHNTGKKHSDETKKIIRQKLSGTKIPIEQRLKRSETLPKGESHHNWKGGITKESVKIRQGIETRLWREAVFARDNWTCQKTGIKGGDICCHHINNFAEYPELRCAIDNGITLSVKSHAQFHKKYGFKNNTKEQIEEFLSN